MSLPPRLGLTLLLSWLTLALFTVSTSASNIWRPPCATCLLATVHARQEDDTASSPSSSSSSSPSASTTTTTTTTSPPNDGASNSTLATLLLDTSPACLAYATAANLSAINSNSTYRSAYLQASPRGFNAVSALLNDATARAAPLARDAELNDVRCGNRTAVAQVEVARNFSMGQVGEFRMPSVKGEEALGVRTMGGGGRASGGVLVVGVVVAGWMFGGL